MLWEFSDKPSRTRIFEKDIFGTAFVNASATWSSDGIYFKCIIFDFTKCFRKCNFISKCLTLVEPCAIWIVGWLSSYIGIEFFMHKPNSSIRFLIPHVYETAVARAMYSASVV